MEEGIVLINKPKGVTSFGVLRILRKKFNTKKLGHAGTLDPLATGLMIVGYGNGTKQLKKYVGLTKEYLAEVRIGERTTTGDVEGDILEAVAVPVLSREHAEGVLASIHGTLRLPVPIYSAMKRGGLPFYARARAAQKTGEVIRPPIRDMEVMASELTDFSCADGRCIATVRFVVGSGTYIRSLAEELGKQLGYPATLQNLRRTRIGRFRVEDAVAVDMENKSADTEPAQR